MDPLGFVALKSGSYKILNHLEPSVDQDSREWQRYEYKFSHLGHPPGGAQNTDNIYI